MGELENRRSETLGRLEKLRSSLKDAEGIATGKACVYATGSFGRCEASPYSDLDLFIAAKSKTNDGRDESLLKRLDEICIKADLIKVTREQSIPEFSGDGRYLVHYSVQEFTKTLGRPEDDVTNTFTARLLLLLESCHLVERTVYREVIEEVIGAYWRDYDDHITDFIPAFLANDILRLWRTFCVNYEARTASAPDTEKAKRKLKNYKLKHSRLLTCYSALLYLLAVHRNQNSVSPRDAVAMTELTPTERLEWLMDQPYLTEARPSISSLLNQYNKFLTDTNVEEKELIDHFMDKDKSQTFMGEANVFGDRVADALAHIGGDKSPFYRLLIV